MTAHKMAFRFILHVTQTLSCKLKWIQTRRKNVLSTVEVQVCFIEILNIYDGIILLYVQLTPNVWRAPALMVIVTLSMGKWHVSVRLDLSKMMACVWQQVYYPHFIAVSNINWRWRSWRIHCQKNKWNLYRIVVSSSMLFKE